MTYVFRCPEGHEFEVQMPMSLQDAGKTPTCPLCDGEGVRVVTGGNGFILQGKDWPGKDAKGAK